MSRRTLGFESLQQRDLMAVLVGGGPADPVVEDLGASSPNLASLIPSGNSAAATPATPLDAVGPISFGDGNADNGDQGDGNNGDAGDDGSTPRTTASSSTSANDSRGLNNFPKGLLERIKQATVNRHGAVGSLGSGWVNNFFVSFRDAANAFGANLDQMGEGCAAWSDWTRTMLSSFGVTRYENFSLYTPLRHQAIRFQLPNDASGTWYIADPWRDPENPIWSQDQYMGMVKTTLYGEDGKAVVSPPQSVEDRNDAIGAAFADY